VRRKSENPPWFEISYSIVAPSGSVEKNLNMDAQLQTITYIKHSKLFKKIARLNTVSVSVSTIGGTALRFWHDLYELDSFCGTL